MSLRCFFPVFGQPLLTTCVGRWEGFFNERHEQREQSWVCCTHTHTHTPSLPTVSMMTHFCGPFRILLAGGMGSLLLDRYGWESMFYIIGFLAGLWAFVAWLCLIKGTVTTAGGGGVWLNNKGPIGCNLHTKAKYNVYMCGSGTEVTPKRMERSSDTQWSLSTTGWLSLLKESPVWYDRVLWSFALYQLHKCPSQSGWPHFCICLCHPLRAMVFTHMCMSSTFTTLMLWLPTYFEESYPEAMVFHTVE